MLTYTARVSTPVSRGSSCSSQWRCQARALGFFLSEPSTAGE